MSCGNDVIVILYYTGIIQVTPPTIHTLIPSTCPVWSLVSPWGHLSPEYITCTGEKIG